MPKITVFLMGQSHKNAAPKAVLIQELRRAQAAGIKSLVLEESSYDLSLEGATQMTQEEISRSRDVIKLNMMVRLEMTQYPGSIPMLRTFGVLRQEQAFLSTCTAKNFWSCSRIRHWTAQMIDPILFRRPDSYVGDLREYFANHDTRREELKLYKELAEAKIAYAGIDIDLKSVDRLAEEIRLNNRPVNVAFTAEAVAAEADRHQKILASKEKERSLAMVRNARAAMARELANTGGLVFVNNLGLLHVQRIAYLLRELLNQQPLIDASSSVVEVNVIALCMLSRVSRNKFAIFSDALTKKALEPNPAVDSREAIAFYNEHPVVEVELFEDEAKDGNEVAFSCPRFTSILDYLIYKKPLPVLLPVAGYTANSRMLLFSLSKSRSKVFSTETAKEAFDDNSNRDRGVLVPLKASLSPA